MSLNDIVGAMEHQKEALINLMMKQCLENIVPYCNVLQVILSYILAFWLHAEKVVMHSTNLLYRDFFIQVTWET